MPSKTLLAFPAAALPPDPVIDLDAEDVTDDEPTIPQLPIPERETGRPSRDSQSALVHATRTDAPWLSEPRFAVDPETGRLILAEPYKARQVDAWGSQFLVECPIGTTVELPTTVAQAKGVRTALVATHLRVAVSAQVIPPTASVEMWIALDDQWRATIVTAFRDGDAGVRQRG